MRHCHEPVSDSRGLSERQSVDPGFSHTATPGGPDRALTASERLRMYVAVTAMVGGISAGLVMLCRSLLRPGGSILPGWTSPWASWLVGRRDA